MFAYRYSPRPYRQARSLDRLMNACEVPSLPVEATARELPIDVLATDDAYVLTAEVPGLQPDALKLEVLGDTVTLRGEVSEPDPAEGSRWLLRERRPGRFARTLILPTEVNGTAAEATIDNGLLVLRLPKAETARPKTVKVTAKANAA